jgi:hypothetical protein
MKLTYYSSLFSMYAPITGAISRADKQRFNIVKPVFARVGIKFDNISAGKLYLNAFVIKKYSWIEAEGSNEPPVMCQSTFL